MGSGLPGGGQVRSPVDITLAGGGYRVQPGKVAGFGRRDSTGAVHRSLWARYRIRHAPASDGGHSPPPTAGQLVGHGFGGSITTG